MDPPATSTLPHGSTAAAAPSRAVPIGASADQPLPSAASTSTEASDLRSCSVSVCSEAHAATDHALPDAAAQSTDFFMLQAFMTLVGRQDDAKDDFGAALGDVEPDDLGDIDLSGT